jgi:lysophospholipase L1-like esterase
MNPDDIHPGTSGYSEWMQWYEAEVRDLERSLASRTNGRRPPVFYGSSSVRLWDTIAEDFDPRLLRLGFGGSTLEACDYFFARLVPPLHPQSLLLYAGDNDLGDGRTVEQVLGSFRSLAGKVATELGAIPFGFVSVKPSPARASIIDRIRRLNELVRRAIGSIPSGYYVDVYSAMLSPEGKPRAELFLEDGLHLNHDGYRLWSRVLEQYRNQIFTSST